MFLAILVLEELLRCENHLCLEERVADKLSDTFYRIAEPQFKLLAHLSPIKTYLIPCHRNRLALPLGATREQIDSFKQLCLVLK